MKRITLKRTLIAAGGFSLALAVPAQASVIQSWEFNDAPGTLLSDAENSVAGGSSWNEDIGGSEVTADGVFRIRRDPPEGEFSSWAVSQITDPGNFSLSMNVAGWNFTGDEDENVRFGFTDGVNNVITAQLRIFRTAEDEVSLIGNALGDGETISSVSAFTASQDTPIRFVLNYDSVNHTYEVGYQPENESFVSIGSAATDPDRGPGAIRLSVLGDYSDTGEFFDIDEISLVPEPSTYALVFGGLVGALALWRRRRE